MRLSDEQILTARRKIEDYYYGYGYPDVMVIDEQGVRFLEVKTEGDQLRRNQLLRLQQLRDAGFRADVVRVRWVLDRGINAIRVHEVEIAQRLIVGIANHAQRVAGLGQRRGVVDCLEVRWA